MDINGQNIEARSNPAIAQNIASQASMSNQDVANRYSSPEARGLLNGGNNLNQSLSYGDKAQSDAIKSRYMPHFQMEEKQLSLDNLKNAQMDHIRNLQVATQAASQEVEINKQKALLKWKIQQQNKSARGAILGQVLGITAGVVAGAYTGGTAAGAGYAAGSAVGNAVGSANG